MNPIKRWIDARKERKQTESRAHYETLFCRAIARAMQDVPAGQLVEIPGKFMATYSRAVAAGEDAEVAYKRNLRYNLNLNPAMPDEGGEIFV